MRVLALSVLVFSLPLRAQTPFVGLELFPSDLQKAEEELRATLAGPAERAFLQILTEVRIIRDETVDTAAVYDLVVRFDPERYRDPHAGRYPLSFADQFILWGKRIARYTARTKWSSGRFYLHDISSGDQAWMFANETRNLYPPPAMKITYPAVVDADNTAGLRPWLKLIHQVEWGTDLRRMSRWFRLMRSETRDDVQRKAIEEQQKAAAMEVQTP